MEALTDSEETLAVSVCPGLEIDFSHAVSDGLDMDLLPEWGPILQIYEGFAKDSELRFKSSSGGVASAIAGYAIASGKVAGVLQVRDSKARPYLNETKYNTSISEVWSCCGSRYSPASPCEGIPEILRSKGKSIIIGKPCDIAAINKACKSLPELNEKIFATISIFCAATPSTQGTLSLIKELGESEIENVRSVRYRGHGWPGNARVESLSKDTKHGHEIVLERSYEQAWSKTLSRYRQWRCNLCPDHTGEFADISVGDPWYREIEDGEAGSSLVISRTTRGAEILADAALNEIIKISPVDHSCLPASQPYLINVAGMIWGRILALKLVSVFGVGVPQLTGKEFFSIWLNRLSFKDKIMSILGTLKRVVTKELWKKNKLPNLENGHDR